MRPASRAPDFPLNDPARKGASILIGRKNFGVGSSREAAVYALVDHGIRCVVATSFGDIFAGNSVNNGLVAAIVSEDDIEKLLSAVEQTGKAEVDLEAQTIKAGNYVVPFTIDPARKTRLLNGWDELDLDRAAQGPHRGVRREGQGRAAVGGAAKLASCDSDARRSTGSNIKPSRRYAIAES